MLLASHFRQKVGGFCMTIRELVTTSQKGNEFISASCSRCFRKGKMMFHIRIDNPTYRQRDTVRYKAEKHDRKGDHPILIISNYRGK